MTVTADQLNEAFQNIDKGALVVKPALAAAVSALVSTTVAVPDGNSSYTVPRVLTDPSASWVAEGAVIANTTPTFDEVQIPFRKLAALTVASLESLNDASAQASADPAGVQSSSDLSGAQSLTFSASIANQIGSGLVRATARALDTAYFGSNASVSTAPAGLLDLTGHQSVTANAIDSLDIFATAISNAETVGASVTAFIASPATVLAIQKLKAGSTSNVPLLATDVGSPAGRNIFGVPLLASSAVAANTVWAIDRDYSLMPVRLDVDIRADDSGDRFDSYTCALRSVMRAGFGFTLPESISKIVIG